MVKKKKVPKRKPVGACEQTVPLSTEERSLQIIEDSRIEQTTGFRRLLALHKAIVFNLTAHFGETKTALLNGLVMDESGQWVVVGPPAPPVDESGD